MDESKVVCADSEVLEDFPILIGIVWVVTLLILSWCSFRKCELK